MTGENVSLFLQAQRGIYLIVMIVLGVLFFAGLVRAVKGPRVADRLLAGNMIGTMVMVLIAVLSMYLQEEYLLDICLIYAMASFLAVIVLAKVYIGIYEEQHLENGGSKAEPEETATGADIRAGADSRAATDIRTAADTRAVADSQGGVDTRVMADTRAGAEKGE